MARSYSIIKLVGKVTYEVDMHDRRKRKRVFHVNMLKKWETPTDVAMFNDEVDPSDEIVLWRDATENQQPYPNSASRTTSYSAIIQRCSEPGRTTVAEHHIEVGDARPIHLPPYRLPHAYRETVLTELKDMEQTGIIERSSSNWAAPIFFTHVC